MWIKTTFAEEVKPFLPQVSFRTNYKNELFMDISWCDVHCSTPIEDSRDVPYIRGTAVKAVLELCKGIVKNEDKIMEYLLEDSGKYRINPGDGYKFTKG